MKKELLKINHETIVFTKHARERLDLRRFSEDMVIQVMRKPNQTHEIEDGKIKFIGKTQGVKIHAICKPVPEENKWLVISVWIRGEDDAGNFVGNRKSGKKEQSILGISSGFLIVLAIIIYFLQQR